MITRASRELAPDILSLRGKLNRLVLVYELTSVSYLSGVSLIDSVAGEIIMELEMQWDGNPSIILAIETRVGVKLPIQVCSLCYSCLNILDEQPTWLKVSYNSLPFLRLKN